MMRAVVRDGHSHSSSIGVGTRKKRSLVSRSLRSNVARDGVAIRAAVALDRPTRDHLRDRAFEGHARKLTFVDKLGANPLH